MPAPAPSLPDSLPILNCAGCGRVMTKNRTTASRYRIRVWGGMLKGRPNCTDCMLERIAPESAIEPANFYSPGQANKLPAMKGLKEDANP